MAKWWGPAGFTNTFNFCEFKSGGRWSFVMHGPDGKNYANENVFAEVVEPVKVVIDHPLEPKFRLTVDLVTVEGGVDVQWTQVIESSEVARKIEHIVVPANDQNLQRLSAEVLGL